MTTHQLSTEQARAIARIFWAVQKRRAARAAGHVELAKPTETPALQERPASHT